MTKPAAWLTLPIGAAMLVLVTALWGASFVVMYKILPTFSASQINLGRFTIAVLAMLPFARGGRQLWIAGGELGSWLFAGYACQTIGLRYTTVNHSAFITAMNVIFVPIIAIAFGRRATALVWAAAITALIGCGLLSLDGGRLNIGDLWTLGTATTYAMYIVRMEGMAQEFNSLSLSFTQLVPAMLLNGVWVAAGHQGVSHIPWVALIYLGIGATAGTTLLQTIGQRVVPAPQAAVIFTMEPVFASIFGYLVLGDVLSGRGMVGAGLIFLAAITSQIPSLLANRPEPIAAAEAPEPAGR